MDGGNRIALGQLGQSIAADKERICRLLDKCCEGHVEIALVACVEEERRVRLPAGHSSYCVCIEFQNTGLAFMRLGSV